MIDSITIQIVGVDVSGIRVKCPEYPQLSGTYSEVYFGDGTLESFFKKVHQYMSGRVRDIKNRETMEGWIGEEYKAELWIKDK